jgi:glycosyltransferase involved in cell wall biosynthesis
MEKEDLEMNHVNVVIPTFDRWSLLKDTLKSLGRQSYKDFSVHVIVDGNPDVPDWLRRADLDLLILMSRGDVVRAYREFMVRCESGMVLNASDDLRFHSGCLTAAVYGMNRYFPRSMGVVGINQLQNGSPRGRKYAFTLMNRRYIDHFPDRIVFCPDYVHYRSDMEHGMFAKRSGCFFFSHQAKVDHIRVDDNTTKLGSMEYKRDRETFRIRREMGLLWGESFKLIGRKNENKSLSDRTGDRDDRGDQSPGHGDRGSSIDPVHKGT